MDGNTSDAMDTKCWIRDFLTRNHRIDCEFRLTGLPSIVVME